MSRAAAERSDIRRRPTPEANRISGACSAIAQAWPTPWVSVVNSPADEEPTSTSGLHESWTARSRAGKS